MGGERCYLGECVRCERKIEEIVYCVLCIVCNSSTKQICSVDELHIHVYTFVNVMNYMEENDIDGDEQLKSGGI